MQNEKDTKHIPVLLKEVLEHLNLRKGEVVLDATFGGGGHSKEICKLIGEKGTLIGMDNDENALKIGKSILGNVKCKVFLEEGNFRDLDKVLNSLKIEYVNKSLFDLGISSDQIESSGRGFSFSNDEPLLMTMEANIDAGDLTAKKILNNWDEKEIADIIYKFGEERFSRRIARRIVETREKYSIETTHQLVEIIRLSVPASYRNNRRINCATRTFQALRIAVNNELGALESGLEKIWERTSVGGRIAVISFHSLEDRIVKVFFRNKSIAEEGKILTKKPLIASDEEVVLNPRSRSAKLRVIEKIK